MINLILKKAALSGKIIFLIMVGIFILMPEIVCGQEEYEDYKNALRKLGFSEAQILQKLKDLGYIEEEEAVSKERLPSEMEEKTVLDSLLELQNQMEILQQKLLGEKELIEVPEEELKPFGYDIFNWIPTSFEPPAFGSIPPDYMVGPGDEIKVDMWGQTVMNKTFVIDREGSIFIDKVGKITVNGLTFEQLKNKISSRLRDFYSRSSVDVSMGNIRSIYVLVIGQVKAPGGYWLTSLSPVYSAPYFAGGAKENGSLRNIELRQGNTVKIIDLYDLIFLRGNPSGNVRLKDGDVIRIPPVGKQVSIDGEIKVPAIYELKENEVLEDLTNIAGGFKSTAYLKKLQIWRIVPSEERRIGENERTLIDVNFLNEKEKRTRLFDGDSICVYPVNRMIDNYIKIGGFARRPGLYSFKEGVTLKELFELCEGVLDEAYLDHAEIIRSAHDTATVIINFELRKFLNNNSDSNNNTDIILNKKDSIRIYSKWEVVEKDSVDIYGEVRNPGRYELYEGHTLSGLIFQSGGLKESAYKKAVEISRVSFKKKGDVTFYVDLSNENGVKNFKLRRFDNVFIRENPNWMLQRNVEITGEVVMPGVYSLKTQNDRLTDLIERAGGLKETAYMDGIQFNRRRDNVGIIDIDLERIMKNRSDQSNIVLVDSDFVYIPEITNIIRIQGAVVLPQSVLFRKGEGVNYYINAAGGFDDNADKKRVSIILANGRVTKSKRFWFDPKITPGSTIFVPLKSKTGTGNWGDAIIRSTQIISALITSIYVLDRVINK